MEFADKKNKTKINKTKPNALQLFYLLFTMTQSAFLEVHNSVVLSLLQISH